MPHGVGFFPRPPAAYHNVRFHLVFFSAAPEVVRTYLPESLHSPTGECVAAGLDVPFSAYGAFQEAFVLMKCVFRDQTGWFCSHVFHNGPAGIAAGREIYGTPKIYSQITTRLDSETLSTEAALDTPVLRITGDAGSDASPHMLPSLAPSWRLKVIPRADGTGLDVKQLIDCGATARDQEMHRFTEATGAVEFHPHPQFDLTPLQPVAYGPSFFMEISYTEHFGVIVHDYLRDSR